MRLAFKSALILTTAVTACGDGDHSHSPDASLADAAIDTPPAFDCETAPSTGTHKVFLQFEGATLTHGATGDATQDRTVFVDAGTPIAIPAWRANDADREAKIQAVVCSLRESLFHYDIEVVTTRPASGDYEMVVIGGRGTDLGVQLPPQATLFSLSASPCAAGPNPREVSWVAEYPYGQGSLQLTLHQTGNMAASTLGINSALNWSTGPTNCMCTASGPCETNAACEFTELSMIPPQGDICGGSATSDNQVMKLEMRYGARS